jgi:alkylresorcinol/alkylpyrone synthase
MLIAAVRGALPDHHYNQDALIAGFLQHWSAQHHNAQRLVRLHQAVQVGGRHLALPMERYPDLTLGGANDAFISVGTDLAERAVRAALAASELEPRDVDVIFTTTVTGIATPSIDARLINRLGFRSDIKRIPMFGLGCVAGAAGTARLADYLRGHPDQVGVLLSVELCSLTLQRGDFSVANLIASGLFGDGAAALVGLGENRARDFKGPTVVGAMSRFYPDTERVMGWDVTDTGFQIVLDASVPDVVNAHIRDDVDLFLSRHNLTLSDIHTVVAHPGGPKVLTAFEDALCLPEAALARTWASLKDVGNMSSASVLFVLRDTLADTPPPPGAYGLMMAMGPGFCSEFVLLRWDTP